MAAVAPILPFISAASSFMSSKPKSSGSQGAAPTIDSTAVEAERRRKEQLANAMGRGSTQATTPFNQQIAGAVQQKTLLGQ